MDLKEIAKEARSIKHSHGFKIVQEEDWKSKKGIYLIAAKLSGIHAEITEMFQAESEENFIEEGIDIIIQTLELIDPFVEGYPDGLFESEFMIWGSPKDFAIMHAHVSEMYEKLRVDDLDSFTKIAHNVIRWASRVVDVAAGADIEEAIGIKMEYNKNRSIKHGGKRC